MYSEDGLRVITPVDFKSRSASRTCSGHWTQQGCILTGAAPVRHPTRLQQGFSISCGGPGRPDGTSTVWFRLREMAPSWILLPNARAWLRERVGVPDELLMFTKSEHSMNTH